MNKEEIKIEMSSQGWMAVTIPGILPRMKKDYEARVVADALRRVLWEQAAREPLPQYSRCVLVYEFIYDSARRHRPTDHDNLELKHCQDVLESAVLINDSPLLCSAFLCSHRGEEGDITRIWVVPAEGFPSWLEACPACWREEK